MEQRSIWWKLFFWLSFICLSMSHAVFLYDDNIFLESNIFSNIYIGLIILIIFISLIGLWGFVYQKRVFYQEFWVYIFFILIVDYIGSFIINTSIETSTQEIDYLTTISGLLTLIAVFIYFYTLYQYAFKMKYLWIENDK